MKGFSALLQNWPVIVMVMTNAVNFLLITVVKRLPQPWRDRAEIAAGITQGGLAILLVRHLILDLGQNDHPIADAGVLVVTALALGFGFWVFRVHHRAAYGGLEIVFACIVAGIIGLNPHTSPLVNATAIGTVVYVVVRGLDNLEQGLPGGLYARLPMRWRAPGNAPPPPPASRSTP